MKSDSLPKRRVVLEIFFLVLVPALIFIIYMSLGKYSASLFSVFRGNTKARFVSLNVRLPRATEAALFGAVSGISGASLQTALGNPLVSPYILGASSGAAFGAALSIAIFGNVSFLSTQPSALVFSLVAIFLTISLSRFKGHSSKVTLVLAGVIVSALFSGLLSLVQIMTEPEKTQAIVAWMIGRLSTATWKDLMTCTPLAVLGILGLLILRWRIFVLSSGEDEARSLGIQVERDRILVIILATVATAAVVSVAGVIGWVCLIAPHITRFIVGPHPRALLPASLSVGASFMLLADLISRTAWTFEVPVGVTTTIVGAPLFLYLMRRSLYEWN